ncbi:hypothetical protein HS125_15735 [bacterium]|nr:hypothetical protein [bacterium]
MIARWFPCLLALFVGGAAHAQAHPGYFGIHVVDASTGRGVPLVELENVGGTKYYTDSGGWIAIDDPALMNQKVWFNVASHGYQFRADGFGFRGIALDVKPGGEATLQVTRRNIAERLYRVTGANIYGDSVLLGKPVPTKNPVQNGLVMGQDSVGVIPYQGKLFWTWGDTGRFAYPLGNFHMSGATSDFPARGGLDPSVGVDLHYYVDENGFSRGMCPIEGPGPVWAAGYMLVPDEAGRRRLVTCWSRMKDLGTTYERGFSVWSDEAQRFEKHSSFDLSLPLFPAGQSLRVKHGGEAYYYFTWPYPMIRVKADWSAIFDPRNYESFTPLAPGSRYVDADSAQVERGPEGRAVWGWKRDTAFVGPREEAELVRAGKLSDADRLWVLRDVESGSPVFMSAASVHWNDYRKRWIMIGCQSLGSSMLGEIWFAEADSPLGPWAYARKVVTHDKYSFYNPTQHPYFDQDGGRVIYFEGTYTEAFSGGGVRTPYYDYNQIMYRLSLDDARLSLPQPVYRLRDGRLLMRKDVVEEKLDDQVAAIDHFAIPPDRPWAGSARKWDNPLKINLKWDLRVEEWPAW